MVCTGVLIMTGQYYYSYSAKGFFWLSTDELKGNDIPADLIPVSEEEHAALFLGQERGKYINHTPAGPVLIDQPDYTPEELVAQAESKKLRLMQRMQLIWGLRRQKKLSHSPSGRNTASCLTVWIPVKRRILTGLFPRRCRPYGFCCINGHQQNPVFSHLSNIALHRPPPSVRNERF